MGEFDIGNADKSNLKGAFASGTENYYSVDSVATDGPADQKETTYENNDWTQYLGYYKVIPELAAAIDAKATWTVGKGFKADPLTTLLLDKITGWGKDTFNTILENMIRTYHVGGDAFAEIITDDDGVLINLKPLDPGAMIIVADRQGRVIRYEQKSKVKNPNKKFTPEKILHLARNRVADEIHGVSMITAIEEIIQMRNEAMADWRRVLHRNVEPMWIIHLDTDDATKIAGIKATMDAARGTGENVYIPQKTVEMEQVTIAPNSSLNPLPWIENLNRYFSQATGVPAVIMGNSSSLTDASAKTEYLVWEQTVNEEQLFLEEQILAQLNLVIKLEFPASLQQGVLSSKENEEGVQANPPEVAPQEQTIEPNDQKLELEGQT